MTDKMELHIAELLRRYPELASLREDLSAAYSLLERCYESGGKLLVAGNGGSAADSEHIAGELMKRFRLRRPVSAEFAEKLCRIDPVCGRELSEQLECGLPAIPLVGMEALSTAVINDVSGLGVFAQQLFVLGQPGDVFFAISTSGNSRNVLYAAAVAKAKGMPILALTGGSGGELAKLADVNLCVPEKETYKIQELHLPVYHCLCLMLEEHFYGEAE